VAKKKAIQFQIEDGCGNYLVMARMGKFYYVVAETRGRSKSQYERLEKLVTQANAVFEAEAH